MPLALSGVGSSAWASPFTSEVVWVKIGVPVQLALSNSENVTVPVGVPNPVGLAKSEITTFCPVGVVVSFFLTRLCSPVSLQFEVTPL